MSNPTPHAHLLVLLRVLAGTRTLAAQTTFYAAGVGSPLELKFLRLFEQHGFNPEKQVPIALTSGGRPITIADFALPQRRLASYIDGASVHVGHNLRRDRNIRDRLRAAEPAWTVVELRAVDLSAGAELVDQMRNWPMA